MEFKYHTATGPVTIEVTDEWGEILVGLDRLESNGDRRSRRHNLSLDGIEYEGPEYGKSDPDIEHIDNGPTAEELLPDAMATLSDRQRDLVDNLFIKGVSGKEYAVSLGVSAAAVTQQKNTVIKHLKKFYGTEP